MTRSLSIIILAGNEKDVIADCIKSCNFSGEVILVLCNCSDTTPIIAKKILPSIKIYRYPNNVIDFSSWRNFALKKSTKKWVLFVDSDERITLNLKKEILEKINDPHQIHTNFDIPRANYFLGKRVRHGNTYPDYVKRLFHRDFFQGYKGVLHEQPIITGNIGYIDTDIIHYTHRDLTSMVNKTLVWTDTEAQALFKSGHPPVVWWRFIRMMLTKAWERLIQQQMWRDGEVGWVSAIFEVFNTFLIYARLWELQQKQNQKI